MPLGVRRTDAEVSRRMTLLTTAQPELHLDSRTTRQLGGGQFGTLRSLGVLAGIAAVNVMAHRSDIPPALAIPAGAVVVASLAKLSGLTLRDLGLSRDQARRGAFWGACCALAVAALVTIALLLPAGRELFADSRFPNLSSAAVTALFVIPLTTVLPEELLFRGALDGSLRRHLGPRAACLIGALAFGAWHTITSLSLPSGNVAVRQVVGDDALGQAVCMVCVVAVTSVAGLGLSWLRRRSGSLLAPIGLHWALNGIGALAAGIVGGRL